MKSAPDQRPQVRRSVAAGVIGLSVGAGVLLPGTAQAFVPTHTDWYAEPSAQRWTVPVGVCAVDWTLQGGAGGEGVDASNAPVPGGWGGRVTAHTTVTPGDSLLIQVGARGQDHIANGGAGGSSGGQLSGGQSYGLGGSGGGATVVRLGTSLTADPLLIAGGGGGAGGGAFTGLPARGGDGGAPGGAGGDGTPQTRGGAGGTELLPGAGGMTDVVDGHNGIPASGMVGGNGARASGGGGGGYTGGGSGADSGSSATRVGGGGGGGANYTAPSVTAGTSGSATATTTPPDGSGFVAATFTACRLAAPVIESATSPRGGEVVVRLHDAPGNEVASTGYEYSVDGGETWDTLDVTSDGAARTGNIRYLAEGESYHLTVRAMTDAGPSPASDAVGVTVARTPEGDEDEGTDDDAGTPSTPEKPQAGPEKSPVVPAAVPATDLTLTTDKGAISSAAPGEQLTVVGTGFAPRSQATIIIYSDPVVLGTVTTDDDGAFSIPVTVPADLAAGHHSLVASGFDADGNERFLRMDVTVAAGATAGSTTAPGATTAGAAAAADGTQLAFTGATVLVPAGLGLTALVGGGVLLLVSRRRRSA